MIVEMKKLTLLGLLKEKATILKALQQMGNVEIQSIKEIEEGALAGLSPVESSMGNLEENLALIVFALDFLEGYNPQKRSMFAGRLPVTPEELTRVMDKKETCLETAKTCRLLEESLTAIKTRSTKLLNQIEQLTPWQGLNIALQNVQDTQKTKVLTGTVAKKEVEAFENALRAQGSEISFERVGTEKEEAYYFIIVHRDLGELVSEVLKGYGFTRIHFTDQEGTPSQGIARCQEGLKVIVQERGAIGLKAITLLPQLKDMEILYDGLNIELEKHRSEERILGTDQTFLLQGWVPARDEKKLMERLSQITDAFQAEFEIPGEREIFPVMLDNPPLVKPFEMITGLYSTPHARGIDPNLYMAPFYFAFFGMMVSDAGYGLILAIAAAFLTKKLKLRGTGRKLGWLLSLGGVSTFFWGVLFGGWFGDAGTAVAHAMGLSTAALWFDPMEQPLLMLGLCFGFGLLQVFVGMGIQAYMNIKRGRPLDALFDQGLWYVFIIGLLLLATPIAGVGKILAVSGAVGLVLTQGRNQEGILKKFFSGVLSLYNTTGFLSDILSYSRLFALGLATGVIAIVINQLGVMLGTSWYMWIVAALILVGGHLFNILINVLGAFVHASRLQYIEFFGKFFEGGGHAFQPLRIQTKYIDLFEKEAV